MGRWLGAAVVVMAGPCLAQEAERVSAAFTWTSLELATVEIGDGREAYARERVVVATEETQGPLAGLQGRCLMQGIRDRNAGSFAATGVCVHVDADGDRLLTEVTEGVENRHTLVEGTGTWTGGTGKFLGASGEFRYSLVSFGLQPPGRGEGTGRLDGTWLTETAN